jgi:signal transduction histidine kinase
MHEVPFTVDSALLRELGERLVGRPHIALAELVKNGYDADAAKVTIRFSLDKIEVIDNGHGMSFEEFVSFWMRIGSPHKQEQRVSRHFGRPVTGSKGVGRLAAQFLAGKLELRTVSENSPKSELVARVNWDEAVQAGDLTHATALWEQISPPVTKFPNNKPYGTSIILSGLNQTWSSNEFEYLAREVWALQPPFKSNPDLTSDKQKDFAVELESPNEEDVKKFETQMRAVLELWEARLIGKLIHSGKKNDVPCVQLLLEYSDRTALAWEYPAPDSSVYNAEFEIRVFKLQNRLKHGIQVEAAREYFRDNGGVHVYDAGFHLPYYGPDTDWLDIEITHSHRLTTSKLLPDELQISRGMQFLPTQSRLFGVVHVNTSREREEAKKRRLEKKGEYLKIQVTRDRLVDNKAFNDLYNIVRTALDFYAVQERRRVEEELLASQPVELVSEKFERVDQVLAFYHDQIPEPVFEKLRERIEEAIHASETEAEAMSHQVGLLGSLATAGMSALAYEHEVSKQFLLLADVAEELGGVRVSDKVTRHRLEELSIRLKEWLERARATRSLFSFLMDEDNRTARARFKVKGLIDEVVSQMGILLRGIDVDTSDIDESLRFPEGGFAEWSAIFQNVFINAVNAMLDAELKEIVVSSHTRGRTRIIFLQDTGSGVDLASAEELFKAFVRKLNISPERRALGLGGTGLGLAIVKMIASNLSCKVSFVEPDDGFNTAFQLSWTELQ